MRPPHITTLALSSLCLLAACGGGGGGGGSQSARPSADIQFPPQASLTDANTIAVRGTVKKPGKVAELLVAGVPAVSPDSWKTWSANVPLALGSNELKVEMRNVEGNLIGDDESVSVERQDVVLGNCTGLAMGDPGDGNAWWVDADRSRLIEIDLASGARTATTIIQGPFEFSTGIETPGDPVFDGSRNRLYVPDKGRIHAVSVDTGVRTEFCSQMGFNTILNIDYDLGADYLISLERTGFPFFDTKVYRVNTDTGARQQLVAYNSQAGEGIPASRISLSADLGFATLASSSEIHMLVLQDGTMASFGAVPLTAIRDVIYSQADGWISILDGEEGLSRFGWWNQTFEALHPLDEMPSSLTLSVGNTQGEYFATDDALDAVYHIDMASGAANVIARSAMGSGPSLERMTAETEFRGERLAIDESRNCVYSIASDGTRAEFAKDGLIASPRTLLALGDTLYVGCSQGGRVVQLDPNGNQSLLTDGAADLANLRDLASGPDGDKLVALCSSQMVEIDISSGFTRTICAAGDGMGPDFRNAEQVNVHPELRVAYVTSAGAYGSDEGQVHMVILDSGFRVLLAGEDPDLGSFGAGVAVSRPRGLAFQEGTSSLLVAAGEAGGGAMSLYSLDLTSLVRMEMSSATLGQGPLLDVPGSLEREASTGNLFMTGTTEGAQLVIDPISGDRVIASR